LSETETDPDEGGTCHEIESAIPHRAPFLLVDRVVEREEDGLTTRWRVPEEADWVRGHYPGEPILPGVLLCEHVFQSAAIHVSGALDGFSEEAGIPVLARIEAARFKRIVRPGDTVQTRVRVQERVGPAWFLSGRTTLEGKTALNVRFVLTATEAMAATQDETGRGG